MLWWLSCSGGYHALVVIMLWWLSCSGGYHALVVIRLWWLSGSGGYHMERGGMPLHDAVGINCKKGGTTENQGSGVKYMG